MMRRLLEEVTCLGGVVFYTLVLIALVVFEQYSIFFSLFLIFLIIYAVTAIIRIFYFKNRPEKMEHHSFLGRMDASSFPSVHAARVTVLAIFLIVLFPGNPRMAILAILLGLLVLYSRIYLKKHDYIDLLAGVIIGAILSTLFI